MSSRLNDVFGMFLMLKLNSIPERMGGFEYARSDRRQQHRFWVRYLSSQQPERTLDPSAQIADRRETGTDEVQLA